MKCSDISGIISLYLIINVVALPNWKMDNVSVFTMFDNSRSENVDKEIAVIRNSKQSISEYYIDWINDIKGSNKFFELRNKENIYPSLVFFRQSKYQFHRRNGKIPKPT
jgi:hypothetical protein